MNGEHQYTPISSTLKKSIRRRAHGESLGHNEELWYPRQDH